jgi:hypothetical protein
MRLIGSRTSLFDVFFLGMLIAAIFLDGDVAAVAAMWAAFNTYYIKNVMVLDKEIPS